MHQIEVDKYFAEEYLTCGQSRYNCVFENCPVEFLEKAEELLRGSSENVKFCCIKLTQEDEKRVEKTLSLCKDDYEKSLLTRDLITSMVMLEVLKEVPDKEEKTRVFKKAVDFILQGQYEKAKEIHSHCPMPAEVGMVLRKIGKAELCFFLVDTKNIFLQRAINNFVSTRETNYKVKIFTTNDKLPSYVDQGGARIESPHDYITTKVLDNINLNEKEIF